MPWTVDDVDDHREGLTEAQKEKWVEVANSARAECIEDGGSESECDARAVRVANSEFEDKGASVLDLERLDEQYIVIGAEGQPAHGEVEDLRELEGDFGDGVYPLWSDGLQSIVAWAFEKSLYDRDEAEEWVAEATKAPEGFNVMDLVTTITKAMGESVAASLASLGLRKPEGEEREDRDSMGAESFDETRRKVNDALWNEYGDGIHNLDPWIIDIGPERAIVEMDGGYWAVSYTVGEDDEVELGEPEPASEAWIDEQGNTITLMAFTSKLQSGEDAEPDEDDGLIWKEIIHPGQWHKMDSGRVVEVTADIIESAYEAFRAGLPKFVSVPAGSYHPDSVAAEDNRGFVEKLKMVGDRLFGGFRFTNPETKAAVEDGSIADCSVYLEPEVTHPESGEKFDWALTHVLLTNNPLVQDLEPFGVPFAASASGNVKVDLYVQDQEEGHMPEHDDITLSAEDRSLLDSMKELGLDAGEVKAMVAERDAVKQKRRDLEVNQVVKALEGADEHDLVEQVDGTRHWPVVIAAAERALREQPEALAMDVEDGRTALDEVVLGVLNAIPAAARMQVEEQPAGPKHVDDPTLEGGEDSTEVKDAKAAELGSQLTPRKGSAVGIG
jgi:hypothetical protein